MIQSVVEDSGGDSGTASEAAALAVSKMFETPVGGSTNDVQVDLTDVNSITTAIDSATTEASNISPETIVVIPQERKNVLRTNIKNITEQIDTVFENASTGSASGLTDALASLTKLSKVAKDIAKETTVKSASDIESSAQQVTVQEIRIHPRPTLELLGGKNIILTQFLSEQFLDPGFTATQSGINLTNSVEISGNVNMNVVGRYELEYSVTANGLTSKVILPYSSHHL